jgi:peptidoglycan-associated lipoprotein
MRIVSVAIAVMTLSACHHDQPYTHLAGMPIQHALDTHSSDVSASNETEPTTAANNHATDATDVTTIDPGPAVRHFNDLFDAFFAYDRADLSETALSSLQQDARTLAAYLAEFPTVKIIVEGHCDERGSDEYNLALGDSRAARAASLLRDLGLPAPQIETLSYGKERPQCTEQTEECWQKNRRAHITLTPLSALP